MNFFVLTKNLGHFWALFWSKIWPFSLKIRFSDIFFETTHQICLKLGQKLGTVALNHQMAVLCLGNFIFLPFWPFLGQKYIACGDIYMVLGCFGSFSSKLFVFFFFFVNFCYLNYVNGLGMVNEKLSFSKKIGPLRAIECG